MNLEGARKDVKVFCIGLQKTGTKSLKHLMRRMGYRHYKRTAYASKLWWDGDVAGLVDTMEAFDSAEDWPWPLCWREMDAAFGDRARFILTRRTNAEAWLDSITRWSLRTNPEGHSRTRIYGYAYPHGAEQAYLDFYEGHLVAVRAAFADRPHQLLEICFEEGDGAEAVAEFLGEEPPRRGAVHQNSSATNPAATGFEEENSRLAMAQKERLLAARQKKAGH